MHLFVSMFIFTLSVYGLDEKKLGKSSYCTSTIFGKKGDKWAGGNALFLGRPVDPEMDVGIAHRTLPIGSLVLLENPRKPHRAVVAQVIDRGPYGAILDSDETPEDEQRCKERKDGRVWCVKKSRIQPGKWRGCVDITPKAAELLGHSGMQRIKYRPIRGTTPPKEEWPSRQ